MFRSLARGYPKGMARSIWRGTISFGLVSLPIRVFAAVEQKDVSFHMVDEKTKSRIRYKRVSERSGREVTDERIVKGYEISKDNYVLVDPDELADLMPEATRSIDIEDFVSLDEIDPIYYEHTYFLAPGKGGEKAYALLHRAMEEKRMVGIGRVVMRNKQYLAAIRPYERALAMETMLFHDEIREVAELDELPARRARVDAKELKMAEKLIDQLATQWQPSKYTDTYREKLLTYIKKKAKGQTVEVERAAEETPKVRDLMDALRASVEGARKAS